MSSRSCHSQCLLLRTLQLGLSNGGILLPETQLQGFVVCTLARHKLRDRMTLITFRRAWPALRRRAILSGYQSFQKASCLLIMHATGPVCCCAGTFVDEARWLYLYTDSRKFAREQHIQPVRCSVRSKAVALLARTSTCWFRATRASACASSLCAITSKRQEIATAIAPTAQFAQVVDLTLVFEDTTEPGSQPFATYLPVDNPARYKKIPECLGARLAASCARSDRLVCPAQT